MCLWGGSLAEELKKNGYNVKATDLIDRGYGEVQDFLKCREKFDGDILTNPPFRLAEDFIKHAFDLIDDGARVWMFLKIQFLEGKKRQELFKNYPLEYCVVNSERICCARNGNFDEYAIKKGDKYTGTTQCYAWYVFKKGYKGKPTLSWV